MPLSQVQIILIQTWAKSHQEISRLWVFGSYAKFCETTDSDLDIAVELDDSMLKSDDAHTDWMLDKETLLSSLQKLIPITIDLHLYSIDNPNIMDWVSEHGKLVYEKASSMG
jgi:predicted nucleotidyltransferase